jgi:hypothetical protein
MQGRRLLARWNEALSEIVPVPCLTGYRRRGLRRERQGHFAAPPRGHPRLGARRFVLGNLEAALSEEQRPGAARKLSGKEEALLIATACSSPPAGRARWTLELLADALVRLTEHDSISRETVRRRLAENDLKPWRKEMWCIPQVDGEFVARMEDVLDLCAEPADPERPVICFDETPIQLIGEVRQPIAAKPGRLERHDCEYKRNGTANLFIFLDAHRPWRKVKSPTPAPRPTSPPACANSLTFTFSGERVPAVAGLWSPPQRLPASGSRWYDHLRGANPDRPRLPVISGFTNRRNIGGGPALATGVPNLRRWCRGPPLPQEPLGSPSGAC